MFQLYSSGVKHTLRALVQFQVSGKTYAASEICRKAGIPEHFSRKMLQTLVQRRILRAVSGPGGGYRLAKKSSQISILSIIESIDGIENYDYCVMGFSQCSQMKQCPLHRGWARVKKRILGDFRKKTVKDLSGIIPSRRRLGKGQRRCS
jgi:Rrf2 family transcriptional regulator, iron-sulfur cluster assembly transcription factor